MTDVNHDPRFAHVQPGRPGFFQTREDGVTNVRKIVRDGSGELWTGEVGSGLRLSDLHADYIAPIAFLTPAEDSCPHDGPSALVHRAFHEQVVRQLEAEVERLKAEKYVPTEATRAAMAAKVHDVWAGWMKWQAKWVKLIPLELSNDKGFEAISRWERQAQTPYEELSEKEQASDLEIADAYLAIMSRG